MGDAYALQQRIVPQATAAVPEPLASGEFANRGFDYAEIQGSLLYQPADRTPSQVLHRWSLQHGVGVIPKSVTPSRIEENFALFDFSLGPVDMALLDGLATLSETGADEYRPAWL